MNLTLYIASEDTVDKAKSKTSQKNNKNTFLSQPCFFLNYAAVLDHSISTSSKKRQKEPVDLWKVKIRDHFWNCFDG